MTTYDPKQVHMIVGGHSDIRYGAVKDAFTGVLKALDGLTTKECYVLCDLLCAAEVSGELYDVMYRMPLNMQ